MSKTTRPDYLSEANLDDLARIVSALAQETWVMRDRMAITEKLLEKHTDLSAADIDDYVAKGQERDDIESMRARFVNKVFGAPIAARERSVDDILARAGLARPRKDGAGS